MDDLIMRLRKEDEWTNQKPYFHAHPKCIEAADLIEVQAAEIARLTDHLKDAQEIIQRQMGWKTEAQNENERLREALDTIKGEMQFPNQLEVGFVHGPITLKDACRRVELARGISSQALQETANDPA